MNIPENTTLRADLFPPARKFETPKKASFEFGIDTVVVSELLASPSIKRMLEAEIPYFSQVIRAPMLKPHLSNFTLVTLSDFGIIPKETLPKLDALLKNWPREERPEL